MLSFTQNLNKFLTFFMLNLSIKFQLFSVTFFFFSSKACLRGLCLRQRRFGRWVPAAAVPVGPRRPARPCDSASRPLTRYRTGRRVGALRRR